MNWIELTELNQLTTVKQTSFNKPVVLFKHSTRCGTSSMVLSRLNRAATPAMPVDFYFLDLIKHRDISNQIAQDFNEYHQSPQLLLIINGECTYAESHLGITMDELMEQLLTPGI